MERTAAWCFHGYWTVSGVYWGYMGRVEGGVRQEAEQTGIVKGGPCVPSKEELGE